MNALEESAFTDAQLAGYEKFWDIISVEKTLYHSAICKGLAEGQHLIATNFKKQGLASELIAQCTGLSKEEIENL